MVERVLANSKAKALIRKLRAEHGELIFHQSGGCFEGSAPMCYPKGGQKIGDSDICLGVVCGVNSIRQSFNMIIGNKPK